MTRNIHISGNLLISSLFSTNISCYIPKEICNLLRNMPLFFKFLNNNAQYFHLKI